MKKEQSRGAERLSGSAKGGRQTQTPKSWGRRQTKSRWKGKDAADSLPGTGAAAPQAQAGTASPLSASSHSPWGAVGSAEKTGGQWGQKGVGGGLAPSSQPWTCLKHLPCPISETPPSLLGKKNGGSLPTQPSFSPPSLGWQSRADKMSPPHF